VLAQRREFDSSSSRDQLTLRRRIRNRLPASAPRFNLRRFACTSSTLNSSVRTPLQNAAGWGRAGTLNHCEAIACRSFKPAYPTSETGKPPSLAISAATQRVLAERFSTCSNQCGPSSEGTKESCSSTRKSSGSLRNCAAASGVPCARGGDNAARVQDSERLP